MALDDFFTLTEMNNGLTAPSRVRELVTVMQTEKDSVVENIGDSTRKWSAVASVIAATESQDCLDVFIQLDGLHFIVKWLRDAQKFSCDSSDCFLENSITHLLRALEKLHLNYNKLDTCQIWATLKDLFLHQSSKVQDKARELFESWQSKKGHNSPLTDGEKVVALDDGEAAKTADTVRCSKLSESCNENAPVSMETYVEEKGQKLPNRDKLQCSSSDAVLLVGNGGADMSDKISEPPPGNKSPFEHVVSSPSPKTALEPPVYHSVNAISTESCDQAVPSKDLVNGHSKFHELESPGVKPAANTESSPDELVSREAAKTSEDENLPLTADTADVLKTVTDSSSPKNYVAESQKLCENSSYPDVSDGNASMDVHSFWNQNKSSNALYAKGGWFNHNTLPKTSEDKKSRQNDKNLRTFLSGFGDDRKVNKLELHVSGSDLTNKYNFARNEINSEPDLTGKKSEVDLENGTVDHLEFARQLAIEVEREVVDNGEHSCSSSDKAPVGNAQKPEAPESIRGKKNHGSEGSMEEVMNDPDSSAETSPIPEESAISTGSLEADQINDMQEMATSQVTETVQEVVNTDKGFCTFDLNEEICPEDADCTGNQFSAPVSIVSALRAAAAPGLPISPLQFEGNLGWKGSAASSAFRPASPRRVPESDKDLSTGGSSGSSKQTQGCLDFDLNITGIVDCRIGELLPDKYVPLSCSLPCGESGVKTNPQRAERLELDLNCASEDGGAQSDCRLGLFFPLGNDHHSRSHSSSSSSKQTSLRNIDLNDQPSFLNNSSDNSFPGKLSRDLNLSGAMKSDHSVISIMGTKVEVKRKDIVSQPGSVPNGRTPELAFDVNLGRPGSFFGMPPYVPTTSVYGYSNIMSAPPLPFSSTIYGSSTPFPYMVDSRGAPVVPQIVGSASAFPPAFSQPPFFISMSSSSPSIGVGPPQSSFDLNSGVRMENGYRDPAGFGQFLNSSQVRSVEGQLRSGSQTTTSSIIGGKRNEPDGGFENYPLKHYTPSWK